ncbi:HAD superfamily hydrolase (TIGR01490 family) [Kineococcus xinjiangensis]|uniref:HAD superfamily hydrolase (TIGR01490 family) n=1 Tax=Kineococcus xinjiangensis TaxID=512762 RepID=A0A2S6IH22_9ACTN|nr:HAD-IB family hydrolase [Kineococcus xinjiangensis]PPK93497.1 HAD superfamily hydrolase (TIGR01490 family) [Kineococcus xinjiangensis]
MPGPMRDLAPAAARATGSSGPERSAAFFDLDNTMIRGASLFLFARSLHARKFFTARDLRFWARRALSFAMHGENLRHLVEVRELGLAFVAGHEVAEIQAIGEELYDEYVAARIWPGTQALARAHREREEPVWLVTAAPVEVADVIARRLDLTGAIGTVAESVDGRYTGRLVGETVHGPAKAAAVRLLAEREGLDLSRCAAYSDSANDLPLLSLVGYPVVVNPDRTLRAHARVHDWPVHEFRMSRRAVRIGARASAVAGGAAAVTGALLLLRRFR